jgi:glycosyltransferase involved in cell wall biosynthesis
MHIALWSPAWPLEHFQNGIVTYVHWMKRGLEERGHRVSVFTGELAGSSSEPDVHLVAVGPSERLLRFLGRLRGDATNGLYDYSRVIADAMSRVHRRDPIDLIEMEESFGWFADVAARTGLPLIAKLHGPAFLSFVEGELDTPFARTKIAREGESLRSAEAIISPCASTLADTVNRYALRPRFSAHIVNPLTMDPATPVWQLEQCDRRTILFVGRFDLRKGADVVLQAFLLLLQRRPDLRLVFVGPDRGIPAADGSVQHFQDYCDALFPAHLRHQVDYRGHQPNTDIAKLRVTAFLTIVASRWENPGYTLLEAMYQGCPVVTSDAAGCRESVTDGVNARVARSGDPQSLAATLDAVLGDPALAKDLGAAARRHILSNYSSAVVADTSLAFYDRFLEARARS